MDRMNKLNIFQDILHFCLYRPSSVLTAFLRLFIVVFFLFLSVFVLTTTLFSSSADLQAVINIDPILNSGPFSSLVLIALLLVSYLSVMTNINPARQKLAFFLFRVGTFISTSVVPRHQTRKDVELPFSDLGDPNKSLLR